MDKEIKEMTLGEKESFKYLDIDEVRKLSFFDFVSYCEGVMSDIANHPDCEICRGKDDYIALKSIEDVTNPMLNSINEKCARIRRTFVSMLDSSVAEQYYIKGARGKAKKIILPRELVAWE